LDRVQVGEDVNELKSLPNDADSQQLLAVVATVAHDGTGQALDDGARCLSEALSLVPTSRVSNEGSVSALDGDEILQNKIKKYAKERERKWYV